jgi:hypothetical protein
MQLFSTLRRYIVVASIAGLAACTQMVGDVPAPDIVDG